MRPASLTKKPPSKSSRTASRNANNMERERVLVVEAHADDLVFFMGGTAAKMVESGKLVRVLTVTTGDQSSLDPKLTEEDLVNRQNMEHPIALKTLGITNYQTLDFTNHFLRKGDTALQLRETLTREIRKFQPTTVCSFDPYQLYDENPDHSLVGRMAWEAAAFSAYPNFHANMIRKEGLKPAYVRRILMFAPREPDFFVDIHGTPIEKKVAAGSAYTTQLRLMFDEIKYRLGVHAKELEIPLPEGESETFNAVSAQLWNDTCYAWAREMADVANKYYASHPSVVPPVSLELAEGFHIVFLGILQKLRDRLPADLFHL